MILHADPKIADPTDSYCHMIHAELLVKPPEPAWKVVMEKVEADGRIIAYDLRTYSDIESALRAAAGAQATADDSTASHNRLAALNPKKYAPTTHISRTARVIAGTRRWKTLPFGRCELVFEEAGK